MNEPNSLDKCLWDIKIMKAQKHASSDVSHLVQTLV